jgi:hypothetical protein
MSEELPINERYLKRQSKILLSELKSFHESSSSPSLSLAQEMMSRVWRKRTWHDALKSAQRSSMPKVMGAKALTVERDDETCRDFLINAKSILDYAIASNCPLVTLREQGGKVTGVMKLLDDTIQLSESLMSEELSNSIKGMRCGLASMLPYTAPSGRVVVTIWAVKSDKGCTVYLRLNFRPLSLHVQALGMSEATLNAVRIASEQPGKLILVSSATSHGKSQTAHALAKEFQAHLIDELRDEATWIEAREAMSKHQTVVATMHAAGAKYGVDRLQCLAPRGGEALGDDVALVLHQRLLPAYCGNCAIRYKSLSPARMEQVDRLASKYKLSTERMVFTSEFGCEHCNGVMHDYIAVFEHHVPGSPQASSTILEHALHLAEVGTVDLLTVQEKFRLQPD